MSSTNINTNTSNGSNELDITNASRGVWLVKVPKYMNTKWQKASPMTEIGRLQINKTPTGKPEILFNLSEELTKSDVPNNSSKELSTIPREHQFAISDIKHQTLAVFSQSKGISLFFLYNNLNRN